MEATGVEPASGLQTRKLLTLRTDKKDKTDTSPIIAYKMHTKSLGCPGLDPASLPSTSCYHATTNRRDLFRSKDRALPMQIITTECRAPPIARRPISMSLLSKKSSSPESLMCSMTGLMRSHCSSRPRPLSRNTITPGCTSVEEFDEVPRIRRNNRKTMIERKLPCLMIRPTTVSEFSG